MIGRRALIAAGLSLPLAAAVESAWFLKTLARTRAGRISFAKPVPQSASREELFLANVPEGRTRHTRLLKP